MASRRRGAGADAFGKERSIPLEEVDSVLFGGLRQADREKVDRRVVNPLDIKVDQGIQVRVKRLDLERVEMLRQVLLSGGQFHDPIVLCRDDNGVLWLADGFHRVEAYQQAITEPVVVEGRVDLAPLRAEIWPGGYDTALEYSEDANLHHGAPLSSEDKKNLLFRRLTRGYYDSGTSNREIAKTLGVVHTTIGRWRDEWQNGGGGANAPLREKRGKPKKASTGNKKRGPTERQLRQRTIKSLRLAVDSMSSLGMDEADEVTKLVEYLAQKWNLK